jgi:TP901 family phage tail tape measure protein
VASPAAILSLLVRTDGAVAAVGRLRVLDSQAKATSASMDKTAAASDRAAAAQGRLSAAATKSRAGLQAASRTAGFVALGVAGIGAAAVKSAANYQQSMNTLQAVSGATRQEMNALRKESVRLGADIRLPGTSAQDAAEAMTEMIKAGVSVKDTMAGVRSTLVLSAAAGISNAEAAEIASNALNAFKLQGKDVAVVADQLANTANASSVEIRDVADSFKMAAAVFSGFQAPVLGAKGAMTELNVAIGILGNAGIKGSDAGTSLKQALLQLTGPSDKSKAAMKGLYLAAQNAAGAQDQLGKIIKGSAKDRNEAIKQILKMNPALKGSGDIAYDAAGRMRSLRDIIKLVTLGTKDMTQEQKNAYLTQIFGADATRSIIALTNAGIGSWDRMTKAVTKQGAAQALADAKMKGLKGSLEALKSSLETLAIDIGTKLLPSLTAFVRTMTKVLGLLSPQAWFILVGGIGAVTAAVWALNVAMNANPYVRIATLLILLATAFVTLYQKSEAFHKAVDVAFGAIKTAIQAVISVLAPFAPTVTTAMQTAANAVKGAASAIAGAIRGSIVAAVNWVRGAMNAIVTEIHKWDVAAAVVKSAVSVIVAIVKPFFMALAGFAKLGLGSMISVIKVALAVLGPLFSAAFAVIGAVVRGAFSALKAIVQGGLQVVHGVIQIFGGIFKGDFGQIWDGIKNIFKGAVHAFGGIIKAEVNTVKDAAKAIGTGIVNGVRDGLSMLGHEILNRFKEAAKFVIDNVGGFFKDVGGAIAKGVGKIGDGVGKEALPTTGSAALKGANARLGPIAAIGAKMGLSVSSGLRRGSITSSGNVSYHSTGEAIDEAGDPRSMLRFFKFMKSRYGSRLAELIYTPGGAGIKDGKPYRYGGQVAADHYDHVHVAMDLGKPGVGDGIGKLIRRRKETGDGIGVAISAAQKAGFSGEALVRMVAIAGRESNYNPHAKNLKPPDHSIGLWQINQLAHHGRFGTDKELEDPDTNARAAWILSNHGTNFAPWSTNRGLSKSLLDRARKAIAKGTGGATATSGGGGGGGGGVAAAKPPTVFEQAMSAANLALGEAETRGPIKTPGLGVITPEMQQISANVQKRSVVSARIKKIRGALKKDLKPATRMRLQGELADLLGQHADIQGTLKDLRGGGDIVERYGRSLDAQLSVTQGTESLADDLPILQKKTELLSKVFEATQKKFGAGSVEAQEAFANLQQATNDLAKTQRDAIVQGFQQQLTAGEAALTIAKVRTPGDLSDDLAALQGELGTATRAFEDAVARGDQQAIIDFGGQVLGLRDSIEQLQGTVEQNTQAMLDLKRQQTEQYQKLYNVSQTELGQIKKWMADAVSTQVGGGVGLGFQTPGFAGGGSRY